MTFDLASDSQTRLHWTTSRQDECGTLPQPRQTFDTAANVPPTLTVSSDSEVLYTAYVFVRSPELTHAQHVTQYIYCPTLVAEDSHPKNRKQGYDQGWFDGSPR